MTGFKFDLSGLDQEELDNLVVIDKDYDWGTDAETDGMPPYESQKPERLGAKKNRRYDFSSETKPELCVAPGEKTAELENVSAYRRKEK